MARFNIHTAFNATVRDGGYTHWNYNPSGDRDSGYVVGNNNTSLVIDTTSSALDATLPVLNVANINAWVNSVGSLADGIGLWLDGNDLYIDAVTYYNADSLPSAFQQAIENKELSIYCLHTKECLDVNPRNVNLALAAWSTAYVQPVQAGIMLRLLQSYVSPMFDTST